MRSSAISEGPAGGGRGSASRVLAVERSSAIASSRLEQDVAVGRRSAASSLTRTLEEDYVEATEYYDEAEEDDAHDAIVAMSTNSSVSKVAEAARRAILNGQKALQSVGVEKPIPITLSAEWQRRPIQSDVDDEDEDRLASSRLLAPSLVESLPPSVAASSPATEFTHELPDEPPREPPIAAHAPFGDQPFVPDKFQAQSAAAQWDAVAVPEPRTMPQYAVVSRDLNADDPVMQREREERLVSREQNDRRKIQEREIERRAMELERIYDRKILLRGQEARVAEDKTTDLRIQLDSVQSEKTKREQEIREEIAETRQATRRTEAQAKQKAKVLREAREKSEKELAELKGNAKDFEQRRAENQKAERSAAARMRKELSELSEERVRATREAEQLKSKLEQGEKELAAAAEQLVICGRQTVELRAVGAMLEGRVEEMAPDALTGSPDAAARSGSASPPQMGRLAHLQSDENSAILSAADAVVHRTVLAEEASLSAEIATSEQRRCLLETEEQSIMRRLSEVEAEAAQMRGMLRGGEDIESSGDETRQLIQQRDEAKSELSSLQADLASAAAAAAARIVVDEAANTAERRETAAAEELSHVYEQLRIVCVNGRRDLEELAAAIEEKHARTSLSRELERTWKAGDVEPQQFANQRSPQEAAELLDAALEAHREMMKDLRMKQLRLLCESEMGLCDLELSQAELCEAQRREEMRCTLLQEEVFQVRAVSSGERVEQADAKSLALTIATAAERAATLPLLDDRVLAPLKRSKEVLATTLENLSGSSPPTLQDLVDWSEQLQLQLRDAKAERARLEEDANEEEAATAEAASQARGVRREGESSSIVVEALHEEHAKYKSEYDELVKALDEKTRDVAVKRAAQEAAAQARGVSRQRAEEKLQHQILSSKKQSARIERDHQGTVARVNDLDLKVSKAVKECNHAQFMAQNESDENKRALERLQSLGVADRELEQTYEQLAMRAEAAARACESEEELVRQAAIDLENAKGERTATESELQAGNTGLRQVLDNLVAAKQACIAARTAFQQEAEQRTEVDAGLALVEEELQHERRCADAFEAQAASACEENRCVSEALAAVGLETAPVQARYKAERDAVVNLQEELRQRQQPADNAAPSPSISEVRYAQRRKHAEATCSAGLHEAAQLDAAVELNESACLRQSQMLDEVAQQLASLRDQLAHAETTGAEEADALAVVADATASECVAHAALQRRLLVARAELAMSRARRDARAFEENLQSRQLLEANGNVASNEIEGLPTPERDVVRGELEEVTRLQQQVRNLRQGIMTLSHDEPASSDSSAVNLPQTAPNGGFDLQERAEILDIEAETEAALCAQEAQWEERETRLRAEWRAAEVLAEQAQVDPQELAQRVAKLRVDVDSALRGLATARGTLAREKASAYSGANVGQNSNAPEEAAGGVAVGDTPDPAGLATALRQERVTVDVLQAMEKAGRALIQDQAGIDAVAFTPGSHEFEQQVQLAKQFLEEQHQQAMNEVSIRGRERQKDLEARADEQRATILDLEAKLRQRRSNWLEERKRLEGRVNCGELEHQALETNLMREISRLEETSVAAAQEAASGEQQPIQALEMSASLREIYGFLCQQQRQLEDASRERDCLQAHLLTALERISRQHAGLVPDPPPSALAAL